MSDIIKKIMNGGGWFENKDPFTVNDKNEPIAPRHHEVAMQKKANEMSQWGKTNIIIPTEQEEISPEHEEYNQIPVEITITVPKVEIESTKTAIEDCCLKYRIHGLIRHELNDVLCIELPISKIGKVFHYLANSNINWNRMYCMNPRFVAPPNDRDLYILTTEGENSMMKKERAQRRRMESVEIALNEIINTSIWLSNQNDKAAIESFCREQGISMTDKEAFLYFQVPISNIGNLIDFVTNSEINWKKMSCE